MKAIELFNLQIKRAEGLLEVHKMSHPKGRPVKEGEAADLLRMVVVFAVAALDAYMHMKIIEHVSKTIEIHQKFPEKCISIISDQFNKDERNRELISFALRPSPKKAIIGSFQKALSIYTFQKPKQMNLAFDMMEISDPWRKINNIVNVKRGPKRRGRKENTQKIISKLIKRRNDIVHEGDFYVSKKYHGKIKKIRRAEVNNQLIKLQRIVEAIEKTSEQDKQEKNGVRKMKSKPNV